MNARIVRADNAQIIATKIEQTKKNSQEPKAAANFGLATGGKMLSEDLIADLINIGAARHSMRTGAKS